MDEPSNAVLAAKLDAFKEANDTAHGQMLTQVVKTNGRVTQLEKFKNIATGAIIILNLLVVPIIVSFILNRIK